MAYYIDENGKEHKTNVGNFGVNHKDAGAVRFDEVQELTEEEKGLARDNIGVPSSLAVSNYAMPRVADEVHTFTSDNGDLNDNVSGTVVISRYGDIKVLHVNINVNLVNEGLYASLFKNVLPISIRAKHNGQLALDGDRRTIYVGSSGGQNMQLNVPYVNGKQWIAINICYV